MVSQSTYREATIIGTEQNAPATHALVLLTPTPNCFHHCLDKIGSRKDLRVSLLFCGFHICLLILKLKFYGRELNWEIEVQAQYFNFTPCKQVRSTEYYGI